MLVDGLDDGLITGRECLQLFQDVRWAIDTAHRNGADEGPDPGRP